MKRLAVLLALTLACGAVVAADVEFVGPDLGSDRSLLFAAKTDLPDGGSFQALFEADPATGALTALTAYPERIALVDGGRSLLVQNRFGLFRTEPGLGRLAPVAGYPAFAQGGAVPSGRILSVSPSPDGSYLLFTEATSPAYCRLLLLDKASGKAIPLAEGVAASVETFPARWSPDSRYFIYSKGDSLYYFGIEQFTSKRLVEEGYRRLGSGHIGAVRSGAGTGASITFAYPPSTAFCPPNFSLKPSIRALPAWEPSRARRPSRSTPTSTTSGSTETAPASSSAKTAAISSSSTWTPTISARPPGWPPFPTSTSRAAPPSATCSGRPTAR